MSECVFFRQNVRGQNRFQLTKCIALGTPVPVTMAPQLRILVALLLSAAASGFLQSSTRAATMGSRARVWARQPSPRLAMAAEPKPLIKGVPTTAAAAADAAAADAAGPDTDAGTDTDTIKTKTTNTPLRAGMSAGMGLIKPIFTAEAQIQGLALGAIGGVGTDDVRAEIDEAVSSNKVPAAATTTTTTTTAAAAAVTTTTTTTTTTTATTTTAAAANVQGADLHLRSLAVFNGGAELARLGGLRVY